MLQTIKHSVFAKDTVKGLTSVRKFLLPKYFYDDVGSRIFQKIMRMPEYYLTRSELEIFTEQSQGISRALVDMGEGIDVVELGPGDGLKSELLLKALMKNKAGFTYIPVDISQQALNGLVDKIKNEIPEISVRGIAGDYFQTMKDLSNSNGRKKLVLFLGSNIGNFSLEERDLFLSLLSQMTAPGDQVLMGFDLVKSPAVLMDAYNDPHGYTRDFNFNHLKRINRELDANFILSDFEHHTTYDPHKSAMLSFLISKKEQQVYLKAVDITISFKPWESIFMELSQKFELETIQKMAVQYGFEVRENFLDGKQFFADSLWLKR